jgi:hypothetical protein
METEMPGSETDSLREEEEEEEELEYSMKWMRYEEDMGSEQEEEQEADGEGTKEERGVTLTFDDEALDLVTQQTHEPRHQHSSSRNTDDRVAAGFPRSDPRHC